MKFNNSQICDIGLTQFMHVGAVQLLYSIENARLGNLESGVIGNFATSHTPWFGKLFLMVSITLLVI